MLVSVTGKFTFRVYDTFANGYHSVNNIGHVIFPKPVGKETGWYGWMVASDHDLNEEYMNMLCYDANCQLQNIFEVMYVTTDMQVCWDGWSDGSEGGLLRESMPRSGYVDKVDLLPYLKHGKNTLEISGWFYGHGGRNSVNSGHAGLIFQCEALHLYSDSGFECQRHPAYYTPEDTLSSCLYGGGNVGFDNNRALGPFSPATEYDNIWGDTYLRPMPLFRFCRPQKYSGKLPYAMWYTVSFDVEEKKATYSGCIATATPSTAGSTPMAMPTCTGAISMNLS